MGIQLSPCLSDCETNPLEGTAGSQGEGQGQRNEPTAPTAVRWSRAEGRQAAKGERGREGAMMPNSLHPWVRMGLNTQHLGWVRVGVAGNCHLGGVNETQEGSISRRWLVRCLGLSRGWGWGRLGPRVPINNNTHGTDTCELGLGVGLH